MKKKNAFTIVTTATEKDEPIFVIRAQDIASPLTIAMYKTLVEHFRCSKEFIKQIDKIEDEFIQWQIDNKDKVKIPD